jgi:plastocyanin
MRRTLAMLLVGSLVAVGLGACGSSGGASRTIEVDYRNDDFAGAFLGYYPREVTVTPGMTLKFHQTWTGEPHSVTFGKLMDDELKRQPKLGQLLDDWASGRKPIPDGPPPEYDEEFWDSKLPSLFGESEGLGQDAAFPCYVRNEADLPKNDKKCSAAQQKQPEFTGQDAYYSSGFIPFEGPRGNTFEMKIAKDAKEGTYFYNCNVHGVLMAGKITVKKGAKVESQAAMNRRGRQQTKRISDVLLKTYNKEKAGHGKFPLPLAGSGDESTDVVEGGVLEFTPRTINAKVGEAVTWSFIGDHTISFNVPPYTPLFKFEKGKLVYNDGLNEAAGGWPGAPEGNNDDDEEREAVSVDAGEFDGSGGLKSSGTGWSDGDKYRVTFTKAGTYPYACLIHPSMIGKVVVK